MLIGEDMSNAPRYKLGKRAGKFDYDSDIPSDIPWFAESGFDLEDPAYVAGYEDGFKGDE